MSLNSVRLLLKRSALLARPLCSVQSRITQPSLTSQFRRYSTVPDPKIPLGQSFESPEKASMKMKISFTCKRCNTRNEEKYFSKNAYTQGVVIITCDGCNNHHLIADNLKWFGPQTRNIEEILAEKGINVKRGVVDIVKEEPSDQVSSEEPYLFPTSGNETK